MRFKNHLIYRRAREARAPDTFKKAAAALTGKRQALCLQVHEVLDHLLKTTSQETIIHGDLQFQHAILTPDGPRLFDPKGLRADPTAEYRLVLTPDAKGLSVDDFAACVARRATLFADATGVDRQRMLQWATVVWGARVLTGKKGQKNRKRLIHTSQHFWIWHAPKPATRRKPCPCPLARAQPQLQQARGARR